MNDNCFKLKFQAWLEKKENADAVDRLVDAVHKRMKLSRLGLYGVAPEQIHPDDIRQELMIFLIRDKTVPAELMGKSPGAMKRVRTFLWHRMMDLSRSRQGSQDIYKDTWRLFYRHVLDVLNQSGEFFKVKDTPRGKTLFSRSEGLPRTLVMIEDLMTIGFPPDLPGEYTALNTRDNILRLARHFWTSSAKLTGEPGIRIDLMDFLAWVSRYVVLQPGVDSYPMAGTDKDEFNPLAHHPGTQSADQTQNSLITTWAGNFFHRLKDREKRLFFYYECKGLPHKAVSELMEMKSNLSYQKKLIHKKLKSFLRDLNWLSPDYDGEGQDGRDFDFFMDCLCRNLNDWLTPREQM